jgi:integrase
VLAACCGLQRGEACAPRVDDVDLSTGLVHLRKNWVELLESPVKFEKNPKSEAGKRTVSVPPHVLPIRAGHARTYAGADCFCVGPPGSE